MGSFRPDKEDFLRNEILYGYLADSEGDDEVVIYCQKVRLSGFFERNRKTFDRDRPGSIEQIDESSLREKSEK